MNIKHNLFNSPLYDTWKNQKTRCNNPKNPSYYSYGGRGVTFSKEFEDIKVWMKYVESLPDAYKDGYSIDRINNEKGYEKDNLRWSSKSTQARNTRRLSKANKSGYRGVTLHKKNKDCHIWRARIVIDKKVISLGYYKCPKDAGKAYDKYVIDNNLEHTTNGLLK